MYSSNPISPEQKQHISLSNYSYEVIRNDALTFLGKINISGFINRILNNCSESYFEDTDISRKDSKLRLYPKNQTLKIRLNNKVCDYYYPFDGTWFGAKYKLSQGEYIKALIEDYSRKTFFQRENIFYKETINTLSNSISEQKGIIPLIYDGTKKFYVKPFRLSNEYEAPYQYLVCLSAPAPDKEMVPASFRISRITDIKDAVTSYGSGKIKEKEKKELERRIKENGVPYIFGDTIDIIVKLTPSGIDMYNSIFHQRPIYKDIHKEADGMTLLTFHLTERQITNYFFPFGKEATIISPDKTHDWIKSRYQEAFESYD